MINIVDRVAIDEETLRINSGSSSKKVFTKLIHMNSSIVLYLIFNQVDWCHGCVRGLLPLETKNILRMENRVLIMTGFPKYYILDMR